MKKIKQHSKTRSNFSIVFPILTIIGIGILLAFSSFYEKSWSYNWNGISEQVRDSIKVAEYGGISSGVVGYAGKKPEQFDRRYWIMRNATESELLKLTQYPSGTIKAIAYEGLLKKANVKNKSEIIQYALDDNEYFVYYQSGCTGDKMMISEYLIEQVLMIYGPQADWGNAFKPNIGLSEQEKTKLIAEYKKRKNTLHNKV